MMFYKEAQPNNADSLLVCVEKISAPDSSVVLHHHFHLHGKLLRENN